MPRAANSRETPARVNATGKPAIKATQILTNSRIAINSAMVHLRSRQTTADDVERLDQVGHTLQYQADDQYQDDAFLQIDVLEPAGLAGRFERRPGVADIVPAGPAEEQCYRQQEQQVAEHLYRSLT